MWPRCFSSATKSIERLRPCNGKAAGHFVTFFDNQDQDSRFAYCGRVRRPDSLTLGLAFLFTLQGIPCVYYGAEQGLTGHKTKGRVDDSPVREAL
jgi:glycosidase